jgi:aspartate aminotransferase-like enzyme
MREHFEIEIGTAFGPLIGKIWRLGAMGYNAMKHKVCSRSARWKPAWRRKACRCRWARRARRAGRVGRGDGA